MAKSEQDSQKSTGKPEGTEKPLRMHLSRYQKPAHLTLEDWQVALRREYGRQQSFELENVGSHPVFSEFHVSNPKSGNTYRVAIRGTELGVNFCSCPDFATNHLGTCKHVEWTLAHLEAEPGGREELQRDFLPDYSEVFLQYGSQRVVRFQPGNDCPFDIVDESGEWFDDHGILREQGYATVDEFIQRAKETGHEFRCYDDTLEFIAGVRDESARQERLQAAFPLGAESHRFDNLLSAPLYPYQKEGALFAARSGRCLIGDEMGLGKTVQALAAVEIMQEFSQVEKVLVVCPTSLKHQWEREISRFTNRTAAVIQGDPEKRAEQYAGTQFYSITNYDVIHSDLDLIDELTPDLVILDEAQRIKNWDTRTAQCVKKIVSPYCIVLTGTPLENRLEELMSIVQFIDQHRLGPTYRFLHEHQRRNSSGKIVGYRNLDQVGETLKPILIRRKKQQVLDQLPARLEKQYFVPMTAEQQRIHDEQREIVARISARWKRRGGSLPEVDQRRLFVALQKMRMVCDSTYLLDQQTDQSVKPEELLTVLEELLEDPETKIVIFSEWVRMLKLVARRLDDFFLHRQTEAAAGPEEESDQSTEEGITESQSARNREYVLFTGEVKSSQRKELLDRFRESSQCRIFLGSEAGGLGLNLQHASVVINLDLPWNPARLEQRIARVHRLGQTHPVQVINFIAEGTIEASMLGVLAFKQRLSDNVLDSALEGTDSNPSEVGEPDLFLNEKAVGSFMATVTEVTENISRTHFEHRPPVIPAVIPAGTTKTKQPQQKPAPPSTAQPDLQALAHQGMKFLEQLSTAVKPSENETVPDTAPKSGVRLEEEPTGELSLRIPVSDPELVSQAVQALQNLLRGIVSDDEVSE